MSKSELELFCEVAGLDNPEINIEVTMPNGSKLVVPVRGKRADGENIVLEC